MVALVRSRPLDLGDALPDEGRRAIKALLAAEPKATRRVYAALAGKVWSLLVERRFDPEIRDWHALINSVKAKLRLDDDAAAERLTALADLLRHSIALAELSPARAVAERPRARAILERLAGDTGFVRRRTIMDTLKIGSSHLSNVLTQLVAHNLVDRRDSGKESEYRITRLGREMIAPEQPTMAPVEDALADGQLARLFAAPAAAVGQQDYKVISTEHSFNFLRDIAGANDSPGIDYSGGALPLIPNDPQAMSSAQKHSFISMGYLASKKRLVAHAG